MKENIGLKLLLLSTEWVNYVAEPMKYHAFMHNYVPRGGCGCSGCVVVGSVVGGKGLVVDYGKVHGGGVGGVGIGGGRVGGFVVGGGLRGPIW